MERRCSAAVPMTPVVIDASSERIIVYPSAGEKKALFQIFLVSIPGIMHTDGETLGFILIYTQSSFFCISAHTSTTQMHLLR